MALPTETQTIAGHVFDDNNGKMIPLHRQDLPAAQAAAIAGGVTNGVAFVVLAGSLVFVGMMLMSGTSAIRSFEKTYRRHKSQELELLMAREMAEHRARLDQRLQADPNAWREILAQLLADAGLNASSGYMQQMSVAPCPHFAVPSAEGRLYMFATDPDQLNNRRWHDRLFRRDRVIPLDASLSRYARIEAQVLWDHLVKTHPEVYGTVVHPLMLPSDATWYLIITTPRQIAVRHGIGQRR